MLNALIRWSLAHRSVVVALACLLCVLGVRTALDMSIDVFPDLTAPTVTVVTEAPGMVPEEVENLVTFPIEAAMNGASGVRRVRSASAAGIAVVWVEFEWDVDIYVARQVVAEKLGLAVSSLPPEVERPVMAPVTSIMGEILFLALTSERQDPIAVRSHAETVLRRRLLSVPGVAQVTVLGGGEKQYQARLDPGRLATHGVTIAEVMEALAASNQNVSAGFLWQGGSEYLVAGNGRVRGAADIAQTVVRAANGVPLRVGDLGDVRIGEAPKRGEGSANGRPAVLLGVQKQPGANTLTLTRELEQVLDGLATQLPPGMKLDRHLFRQASFIEAAIRNVVEALRDGAVLVVAIVLLFLWNLRATLVTLTALPLALAAAILTLRLIGANLNTMTLGGLAIAMGALVDDAVIDVENVCRRLRDNSALPPGDRRPVLTVVYAASSEIRSSIFSATMIILVVFLPLFFLTGVEGRMLRPLGFSYVVALSASLVVAVTVTPVLCALLLPGSRMVREARTPRLVTWSTAIYGRVLEFALRRPLWFVAPAVLGLLAAIVAALFLGRAFLPEFNEGALTVNAVSLPGISLPESDALGRLVEKTLLAQPEVTSVARRTGRAELDEHVQGVEAAELDVAFLLKDRTREAFLDALRRDLSLVPGVNVSIGQPISHRIDHMLSGTKASIAVKIFGPDLYRLRSLGERARRAAEAVPGVVDLSLEQQVDVPILRVNIDRVAAARQGVTVRDVARVLEAAVQGVRVSRVLEGRNAYDLVVRLGDGARLDDGAGWRTDTLGDVPVETPGGARVPLKSLARIAVDTGPNLISREQVERKIVVQCNVAGRDVTSVVAEIGRSVDPIVAAEPGYRVEYGGQFESAAGASRTLGLLGVLAIAAVGLLLHLTFGSVRDAVLVMVNLPLALIGGVAGVYLTGGVLSVASLIGFISVFGIAARNGIMLVSHIRHLQEHEGVTDFREAVVRGSVERLTPILMTALATGLALVPLVVGGGKPGNEIQTPMAVVILAGLLTSMLLNMLVVPVLYLRFGRPAAPVQEEGR